MAQSAMTTRRSMSKLEKRNTLIAYSFLAPNFLGFIIFTMIPVVFSVVLAFLDWGGGAEIKFVGLGNFQEIFKNFSFTRSNLGISLKNTVFYTIATVPLTIAFALGLALGELAGPNPAGAPWGHGHDGWTIWGGCFLLSLAMGGVLERLSRRGLAVKSRAFLLWCALFVLGMAAVVLLVKLGTPVPTGS